MKRLLNALILGVASLIGVASFLYPFYQPSAQSTGGAMSHGSDAPFATFGFLLGALSLLVSAFIGGGIGPWMPYQMFASGWVGLTSSWLPDLRRWRRAEVILLATWGLVWGFFFGAVMNLWFWPYVFTPGDEGMYWQPGIGLIEVLKRYAAFYALTSLWWDLARAGGNALLLLFFAAPVVKLLRRFQQRFHFETV